MARIRKTTPVHPHMCPGRRALALAAGLAWLAGTMAARAQDAGNGAGDNGGPANFVAPAAPLGGLPPEGGVAVNPGDLRMHLQRAYGTEGAPLATQPGWVVTPSIGVTEILTDNALAGQNNGGGSGSHPDDLITEITPGIAVTGDTERVQVNLNYAPTFQIYAENSSQNSIDQNFFGSTQAVLIPDHLFLDLRGGASTTARNGGYGPPGSTTLTRQDQVLTTSFSAAPTYVQRVGDLGTAQLTYRLAYTNTSQLTTQPAGQPSSDNDTLTNEEHASFATDADRFRLRSVLDLGAVQQDGTGVLSDAHRSQEVYSAAYPLNHIVALTASAGHEDIYYSGTTPVQIDDLIWSGGGIVTPDADSRIAASYGHHDGRDSLTLDSSLAPTARLRLFLSHSEAITTDLENFQSALSASALDQTGNLVDPRTGAPVVLANNSLGVSGQLYYQKRTSATATLLYDRDTFSVTVTHDSRKILSSPTEGLSQATSYDTTGMLSWSHDVSDTVQSTASVSDTATTNGQATYNTPNGTGDENFLSVTLALNKQFSETLTGTVQYTFNDRSTQSGTNSSGNNNSYTENRLLVGLVKRF